MDTFDLSILSLEELRAINSAVVQEIRDRQSKQALTFKIGQTVTFPSKRGNVVGTVIRRNQRTLSVQQSDANVKWTVCPNLCRAM